MAADAIEPKPELQLDQATILSAGLVFAVITALFGGLSLLPDRFAYFSNIGTVLAPLICVPIFSRFRQVFLARQAAAGHPRQVEPAGYRFLSRALITTLLLTFVANLFNLISIVQKTTLLEQLRDEGVALDQATIDAMGSFGDGAVVLPLLFLTAVAVGWTFQRNRIDRPALTIGAIFLLMTVVRGLYLGLSPTLRHALAPLQAEHGVLGVLAVALFSWPVVTAAGIAAGFGARMVFEALLERARHELAPRS